MGIYLRKSLKAGPFRFNLSGSGIGVSAGVPGFRVGTGPRGNYVRMGAGGVHYRAGGGRSPMPEGQLPAHRPEWVPTPASWHPSSVVLTDITGASVAELQPSAGGDMVAELNEASRRVGIAWPITIAAFVLGLVMMPWGLILWALAVPLCWWLFLRDQARRSVVVFYDVNDAAADWFSRMVDACANLANSQKTWRLSAAGQVQTAYQHKTNAGAGQIVSRDIAGASHLQSPRSLVTNVAVPSLNCGKTSLHFLPDRVLVREGKQFTDVGYDRLSVHFNTTNFIESSGSIPTDASRVGQTWQYVNMKGGPDRRFANNRVLPIMLYGEMQLRSDTGLRWDVQASSVRLLKDVSNALLERKNLRLSAGRDPGTGESGGR